MDIAYRYYKRVVDFRDLKRVDLNGHGWIFAKGNGQKGIRNNRASSTGRRFFPPGTLV
jgi:hypothetical protein